MWLFNSCRLCLRYSCSVLIFIFSFCFQPLAGYAFGMFISLRLLLFASLMVKSHIIPTQVMPILTFNYFYSFSLRLLFASLMFQPHLFDGVVDASHLSIVGVSCMCILSWVMLQWSCVIVYISCCMSSCWWCARIYMHRFPRMYILTPQKTSKKNFADTAN